MTTLERFIANGAMDEENQIERLRYFCSLCMTGQDWLDIEQFFNDVEAELSATKEKLEAAEQRIRESQEQEPKAWIVLVSGEYSYIRDTDPELFDDENIDSDVEVSYVKLGIMPIIPQEIEELKRENAELKAWKESAISVTPDYQAIGKALGVKLGETVHDKILPAIIELQFQNAELRGILGMQYSNNCLDGLSPER